MLQKLESDSSFPNVRNQLYATIIGNWIVLTHGTIVGWLSPALPILFSDNTPLLTGPLTHSELSWISSISSIGAIVGTFLFGIMSSFMGSKRAMTFLAFPAIAYWILVKFGNTFYYLLLARFITGWTVGGMQSGVALYVAEISNDNIRGRLGSITPLARNVGVLMGFSAGAFVEYENRPYIFVFFPIMFLIWLFSLPNTPQHYLHTEQFDKAEKALMYYKGCTGISERERSLLKAEYERLRMVVEERKLNKKLKLSDFCNRMALKGIATSIAMAWFIQMTGIFLIANYASLIFYKSGTSIDPNIGSIILAILQIIGGLVSTQFGDTFGRKTTLYLSLGSNAVGLFTFSVYLYLREIGFDVSSYSWLPLTCLSVIIFVSSAGIVALAGVVAIENFPPQIRTTGVVFYSLCVSVVAFLADKFFPILMNTIGLEGCLLFFTVSCCCGVIFVAFMKETKGKSLDSMEKNHSDKNKNASRV